MPLTLLTLLLVSVLGFTLVTLGMTEVTISTNWSQYNVAFYAADAGIEAGVVALRNLLATTPNPTADNFADIKAPALVTPGITFTNYSVTWALAPPSAPYQMIISSGPYAGLTGLATDYRITSQATGPGGTRANLTEIVSYVQVPLFQFGVFYGKGVDLEFAPGPAMTFNGRVHANSNVHLGAGATLQFDSLITTAGSINRWIKRDPTSIPWQNDPQIKDASGKYQPLNFDSTYQPGFATKWGSTQAWASKEQSTFGGQVKDKSLGVGEITPLIPDLFYNPSNPDVVAHQLIELTQGSDSPALQSAKLYSQAGLRIIQQPDGSISSTDQNGSPVTPPAGTVTTTESFWDAREGKTVKVIQVDVGKLNLAPPANGLLYVASKLAPTSSWLPAVRLVNGSTLPSSGLTVASQNPVYIQGDYNTLKNGPVNPATGLQTHPPAAVLADAITVLSNNWKPNNSDSKGDKPTDQRPALSTTVNAGLATGPSAESVVDQGNGQLENDIRFLEYWSGQTLTYSGSLVNLWHSQQATGAWRCCGTGAGQYYSPPIRNWSFDTLFSTVAPPGTPSGILILKGAWSQS